MTEPAKTCSLCDQSPHEEPIKARFNLTCPGENADEDTKNEYLAAHAGALIVSERYCEDLASKPEVVKAIWERQAAAVDRFDKEKLVERLAARPEVSRQELVSNVNALTPVVHAMVEANADLAPQEFEVEPAHLTVEKRIHRPATLVKGSGAKHVHSDDYSLFIDPTK